MILLHVRFICWYRFPSSGSCSLISSELKMGSKYSQECWHISHSSSTSCMQQQRTAAQHKTIQQDIGHRSEVNINAWQYSSYSEFAVPGVDLILEVFFERWERHALYHDNVVIQQLRCFIRTPQNVGSCLLVGQHVKHHRQPLLLHFFQGLGDKVWENWKHQQ